VSLEARDPEAALQSLQAAGVVVVVGGDNPSKIRVSPCISNNGGDIDRLVEALAD